MVDSGLTDDFLQDVAQASGEDEDRHIVLLEAVEELLIAFPESEQTQMKVASVFSDTYLSDNLLTQLWPF